MEGIFEWALDKAVSLAGRRYSQRRVDVILEEVDQFYSTFTQRELPDVDIEARLDGNGDSCEDVSKIPVKSEEVLYGLEFDTVHEAFVKYGRQAFEVYSVLPRPYEVAISDRLAEVFAKYHLQDENAEMTFREISKSDIEKDGRVENIYQNVRGNEFEIAMKLNRLEGGDFEIGDLESEKSAKDEIDEIIYGDESLEDVLSDSTGEGRREADNLGISNFSGTQSRAKATA